MMLLVGWFGYRVTRPGKSNIIKPAMFYTWVAFLTVLGVSLHIITYNTIPWSPMDLHRGDYTPDQTFHIINTLGSNEGGLGAADVAYVFGNPGDTPFVGDFDGDGVDTVGLHRASTGLVYFRNTHTQGIADNHFIFGDPGDRFVAGDWNHDGIDTPAVYRPSNTTHYFRFANTQGNADAHYIWGEPTWLPVTGHFTHN
jgi:hypothetical protein